MKLGLFLTAVSADDDRYVAGLLDRLDDAERTRAAHFAFDRDRRTYVVAHALLRHALDLQAGARPWRFVADAYGKPHLDPPCDDIRFSLSHTNGMVAVALAQGQDVGVDVEAAGRDPDEAALASLALAPEEVADLDGFADRRGRLLQLWVAKEALAKAIGEGLSLPLQQVVLRGNPLRVEAMPDGYGAASTWWLRTEWLGTHWLALAAGCAPSDVEWAELSVADLVG
ncbi:4'-phosphopantetheinyl transferase superfamily protein [Acidisphaera sp. S103]|uniref:4'-phosphopantetheinyl transferase family protein n=1 Tax=Acidisphaera sp. S103 TaxID=1747223 RepID=UPI00131DD42D|nr:4'-phosphopantetheinyl transferase superfamily protein [Acidisphaera sp. S103]